MWVFQTNPCKFYGIVDFFLILHVWIYFERVCNGQVIFLRMIIMILACAPSEIVYRTSNSDEPFDCSFKSCPRGYSCIQDIWNKEKKVCCGAPNFGRLWKYWLFWEKISEFHAFMMWRLTSCMPCEHIFLAARCNFVYSYFAGVCPSDQRPLLDPRTQQPRLCIPNQPSSCPNDFLCIYNDEKNTYYCCGEAARVGLCIIILLFSPSFNVIACRNLSGWS